MTDNQWPVEVWAYTGERLMNDEKLKHCFIAEGNERLYYGKAPKYAQVGAKYAVECKRKEDGGITARIQDAKRLGMVEQDAMRQGWLAEHNAAIAEAGAISLGKKLAKENTELGDMTLRQVRQLLMVRRGLKMRAALLAVVLGYIDA